MTGQLSVGEVCAGYGGLGLALSMLAPARTAWVADNDPAASKVLTHRFPDAPNLGDITTVDWAGVEPVDVITGGTPCFPAGTLVDTRDGYVPIETVHVGALVRTHRGRWRRVVQTMRRVSSDTVTVDAMGAPAFTTTREHPFYVRRMSRTWDSEHRRYARTWAPPQWVPAGSLTRGCFLGLQLDTPDDGAGIGTAWAYLTGRWLADGWVRDGLRPHRKGSRWWQVTICAGPGKEDSLEAAFTACGLRPSRQRQRTVTRLQVYSRSFVRHLEGFGRGAQGKRLPGWVYRLPLSEQAEMLRGYLDGDGSSTASGLVRATTASPGLAHGIARLARNTLHRAVSVHYVPVPETTTIEGRTVRQRPQYQVVIPGRNREALVEDGWVWVPVRGTTPGSTPTEVYNIGVDEDESYTAWGYAVHNCQDVSTAGRRAGMRRGTRSGLWASMREAVATTHPTYVIWENVLGALSAAADSSMEPGPGRVGGGAAGPVLRAAGRVLGDLASLGYDAAWTTVSASSIGLCHQRRRLFVLAVAQDAAHAPGLGLHRGRGARDRGTGPDHGGGRPVTPLLPTPTVTDMGAGRSPEEWQEWVAAQQAVHGNGHGRSLSVEARRLMPTPQVQPDLRQSAGWGVSLSDSVRERFGEYTQAVGSHAQVVGRPPPPPTEPGSTGTPRLSARFVEWMMCLPPGWVTGVPGVSRAAQLRLLGNGVVPHQAAHALAALTGWHDLTGAGEPV